MDKYEELYQVDINEVINYFGINGRKVIEKTNVKSLGQLIELFESKEFITTFIRKHDGECTAKPTVYLEMLGTIKILKLKYLGIDPNFSETSTWQELGFSTRFIHSLYRSGIYYEKDVIEMLLYLSNKDFIINEFMKIRGVGEAIAEEAYLKAKVLNQYFNEKNKSDNLTVELIDLVKKLGDLLKQQEIISEQIEELRRLITEKVDAEDKDGTIRKK